MSFSADFGEIMEADTTINTTTRAVGDEVSDL